VTDSFAPLPTGCSQEYAEERVRAAFPGTRGQSIVELIRPSIRIWPKPSSGNLLASRFGGIAAVPSDWAWPIYDDEQLVFVAQINCAELYAEVGGTSLPRTELLSFFGGDEEINGCGATVGGLVYHFHNLSSMKLASKPREAFKELISCDLSFYKNMEIPDPESLAVRALGLTKDERDTYYDTYDSIALVGFPERWGKSYISKLLGWPDLVQDDLDCMYRTNRPSDLLLQIGWYRDGTNLEGWGPGGVLYFSLERQEFAAGRFGMAKLQMQGT
jgi:uncharacterized protein YwqG